MSKAMPTHFDTFNKKEFVKHNYQVSTMNGFPHTIIGATTANITDGGINVLVAGRRS